MKYTDYLKSLDPNVCPFCTHDHQRIYRENDSAYLTYALAPYHKHHLLIIPNRHVLTLLEMSEYETAELWKLIHDGMETLRGLGYKNLSVLVREGDVGLIKSVAHLHFHIIPNHRIGDLDINGEARVLITDKELEEVSRDVIEKLPRD